MGKLLNLFSGQREQAAARTARIAAAIEKVNAICSHINAKLAEIKYQEEASGGAASSVHSPPVPDEPAHPAPEE